MLKKTTSRKELLPVEVHEKVGMVNPKPEDLGVLHIIFTTDYTDYTDVDQEKTERTE
ncbi:MAG: hypothetical protein AAF492_23575 [Verrucomicrobiota bacterium]